MLRISPTTYQCLKRVGEEIMLNTRRYRLTGQLLLMKCFWIVRELSLWTFSQKLLRPMRFGELPLVNLSLRFPNDMIFITGSEVIIVQSSASASEWCLKHKNRWLHRRRPDSGMIPKKEPPEDPDIDHYGCRSMLLWAHARSCDFVVCNTSFEISRLELSGMSSNRSGIRIHLKLCRTLLAGNTR